MSSSELLTVHTDTRDSAVIVSVRGEVDLTTVPMLRECFDDFGETPAAPLVVDLSEVTFIGSVGLALLVDLHRRCAERGVAMDVVATGSVVPRALQVTALDQLFSVHPTVDEAIGSHGGGARTS